MALSGYRAVVAWRRDRTNNGHNKVGGTVFRPARLIVQIFSRLGPSDPQAGP
jgi:hypothetical protein